MAGRWEERPWESQERLPRWEHWRPGRPESRGEYGEYREYDERGERELRSREPPRMDRPWVEPSPERRRRGDTRGLMEWEDRGPLAWMGKKVRESQRPSRGPKGYSRSDERILDEVCERIARSGVDADDVEIRVEGREVTLTGTVRSREEKWWLEDLSDDVYGVEEVHNRLRVSRSGTSLGEEATRH